MILVIEDSATYAKILQAKLKRFGEIEIVKTLNTARQKNLDDYDVIILDHILPDGDSIDFLQSTKTITPFIVLTGSELPIKDEVLRSGAFVYMEKTNDQFLETTIEMCIRHKKIIWSEAKQAAYKEIKEINQKIKDMLRN